MFGYALAAVGFIVVFWLVWASFLPLMKRNITEPMPVREEPEDVVEADVVPHADEDV